MATIRMKGRGKSEAVETPSRLLLVDPYGGSREGLGAALRGGGLLVETAASAPEALAKMEAGEVDLAVVALDWPHTHGLAEKGWALLVLCRVASPALPLILIAADCEPHTQAE